jgi:hypothetical protein
MSRNYGKKKDRKKDLIFAALSDMLHNGLFPTRNDTPRRDERESGGFDH